MRRCAFKTNNEDEPATKGVLVSRALKDETRCDKLNVAAIGNVVPQLHSHIVARTRHDALWPNPVWGAAPARAYDPATLERFLVAIRERGHGASGGWVNADPPERSKQCASNGCLVSSWDPRVERFVSDAGD